MKPIYFALSLFGSLWLIPFVTFSQQELVHWESRANEVEIIRDDFGSLIFMGPLMQMQYSACSTHNAKMILEE